MPISAGRLFHKLQIEQPSTSVDAIGQPVDTWTPVATVYGDVRYQRGLESIRNGAPTSVASTSIRIRYRSDIQPGMRITRGVTVFNIVAVLPQEKDGLDLQCEVVN